MVVSLLRAFPLISLFFKIHHTLLHLPLFSPSLIQIHALKSGGKDAGCTHCICPGICRSRRRRKRKKDPVKISPTCPSLCLNLSPPSPISILPLPRPPLRLLPPPPSHDPPPLSILLLLLTSFLLPGCTSLPIVYHPLPLHLGASRPVSPCSGLGSTPPFLPPSPTKRMTQSIPSPLSLSLFLFPYIPFSSSHHSQLTHVDQLLFLSLFFKITHLVSSVTFKRFLCVHFCAAGGKNCVLIEALFKR